jgi:hypothetical protein
MTGQEVKDWYRERIAQRERYVSDAHNNTTRARAALDGD